MKLEILEYLPKSGEKNSPLIFVHGAHHGAWCWEENFLPYFSEKGFPAYALSLRGHGKSQGREELHSFSFSDYTDDVLDVIHSLKEQPILIGHSMGGAIVQKILHLYPDKIKAAVLMASVSHKGMVKDLLRVTITSFRDVMRMMKFNEGENVGFPPRVFFSQQLPVDIKNKYLGLLQPESNKARNDLFKPVVPLPINTNVPILVLGSKKDWYFPHKTAKSIGKAYQTKAVIFPDISHDMMLDPNWQTVADRIIAFLSESHPHP